MSPLSPVELLFQLSDHTGLSPDDPVSLQVSLQYSVLVFPVQGSLGKGITDGFAQRDD